MTCNIVPLIDWHDVFSGWIPLWTWYGKWYASVLNEVATRTIINNGAEHLAIACSHSTAIEMTLLDVSVHVRGCTVLTKQETSWKQTWDGQP